MTAGAQLGNHLRFENKLMLSRLFLLLRRYAPYVMVAVIALTGLALWHFSDRTVIDEPRSHDMELVAQVLLLLIGAAPLLVVIWFLYLFTGIEVSPARITQ